MKAKSIQIKLSLLAIAVSAIFLQSCATTDRQSEKQEALVCPKCKMVAITTPSMSRGKKYRGFPKTKPDPHATTTTYTHSCPECQGLFATFLKEGQLKHECSICENSLFVCPVFHPHSQL